ncbi:hypothetical protein KEM55_003748 [Ascosphaera atra]|nr:hypothetical protein KEM55_003748 [Ascosphaera atra]
MPDFKESHLKGLVETSFANPTYLKKNCITPEASRTSCLQLQMLGQSYHHYQEWLSSWFGVSAKNNYSTKLSERPPPTALWLDNTTVTGWWLDDGDSKMKTRAFGRMINNVTYAFPHTGVFAATKNGRNKIHRPDVDGATGALEVIATVSSPILNTLCVGASAKDLEPLIIDQWPQNRTNFKVNKFALEPSNEATLEAAKNNKTALDSVFEWDSKWNPRPIFGKYPPPKTNVINFANLPASTIHIVFPVPEESRTVDNNFTICALKAGLQGGCSTRYHEESSGGDLRADCSSDNKYAYRKSNWSDLGFGDSNFASLSISWAEALTLGQGIYAGSVVAPVDLTNFVPDMDNTTKALTIPSHKPTVAEVLGVMAGAVLLGGTQNATFGHTRVTQFLNDTEDPTYEKFKALTRASLLQSGGPRQGWQKLFFLVLFIVCVMSLLTCLYLAFQLLGRHITDFTETQNIFTLAVNSPPTSRLAGACGTGPNHAQLGQPWLIDMHEGTNHYFLRPIEKEATITPQGPLISRSTTAYFSVPNEDRSIASSGRPESLNEYRAIVRKADKKPFWSYLDPLRLYRKASHRRSAAKALSGGKD